MKKIVLFVIVALHFSCKKNDNSGRHEPTITTVAGGNGKGDAANQIKFSQGMFVTKDGTVYIADEFNHRVQKWPPGASEGITVAGGNGAGNGAHQLNAPIDVHIDSVGNVYVADLLNQRIQKWTPGASVGITVAGGNGQGSAANQFSGPNSLFVDAVGNIFVLDVDNTRIQKWAPGATSGTTVISDPSLPGTWNGLWVDSGKNFYVSNYHDRVVKYVTGALPPKLIAGGNVEGAAPNQLNHAMRIFVDATSNLYICDEWNRRVQKWTPGATEGITVAGGKGDGSAPDQIAPEDVQLDGAGNLYVLDYFNYRVQKWTY